MNVAQAAILGEVLNERDKQIQTTEEDDQLAPIDWFEKIQTQKEKLLFAMTEAPTGNLVPVARARLIKIAALALAGIESIDRWEK